MHTRVASANMEGIAVFLPILCSFLNGYWTSACSSDNDCNGIERCCKVGHFEEKSSCVNRANCFDFCYSLGDCSAPERCDRYINLCTTACSTTTQCHRGYICDEGHCVWDEDSAESELNITTLIAVIVGLGALLFLVCCCMKQYQRRSDRGNRASGNSSTNRTTGGSTPRQNGEVDRLQMRTNLQGDEESGDQIPDPIAEGGPPSYSEVSAQPESPPPSYEEVMKASHEILPPNVHEHQV